VTSLYSIQSQSWWCNFVYLCSVCMCVFYCVVQVMWRHNISSSHLI